jgi:acrylyl-CoA reductase (NADPH)
VGGTTLASVLSQMRYRGSVAAVGLAGGNQLETTVLPFLLRGVSLLGIDSVMCPVDERRRAWQRLAVDLPMDMLDTMTGEATLADVPRLADEILAGRVKGRMVIDLAA